MVTLFAIPKAFRGHTEVIQRNAIESWALLGRGTRVVLFGDEDGTAEVAGELHVEHLPGIERNEFGTPLVNALFEEARRLSEDDVLCYVNSDVLLLDDFLPAIDRVRRQVPDFLMIGECWNLDLRSPVAFGDPLWETGVRHRLAASAALRGVWAIDYFAFSADLYDGLPPFAVGRAGFDNWLVWKAGALGATVVDASRVVTAVHQRHDYSHVPGGEEWCYDGPEAIRNRELAGGHEHLLCIDHASHVLTPRRLRRRLRRPRWVRSALEVTQSARHRVGFRPATALRRLRSRAVLSRGNGR